MDKEGIKPLTLQELMSLEKVLNKTEGCFLETFDCRYRTGIAINAKDYTTQIIEPIEQIFNRLMASLKNPLGNEVILSGPRGELALISAEILDCAGCYLKKPEFQSGLDIMEAFGDFRNCVCSNIGKEKIKEIRVQRQEALRRAELPKLIKKAFSRDSNKHRLIPDQNEFGMGEGVRLPLDRNGNYSLRP